MQHVGLGLHILIAHQTELYHQLATIADAEREGVGA